MDIPYKNKKVAIIGLGVEGLSSAKFLKEQGAEVTFLDQKTEKELNEDYLTQAKQFRLVLGPQYLENLTNFDIIVRSPGVKYQTPEILKAKEKGVVITSHTRLFFDLCPSQIIGVTGTKGKGTTSTLIYEMLKKAGFDAYLGGNIGVPPLDFLESLTDKSWVVLELSSFQLLDLTKSPHIAVMLMITSDHMDYHKDEEEYVDAKRNILRFQDKDDFAIVNRDYIASNESDIHTDGKVFYITRERSTTEQGCFVKNDAIWMSMKGTEWKIIDTKEIALPGKHNFENACAAAMAATLAGASKSDIVDVLKTFKGLPHRLELVKEVNGVKYFDDSISTTPETAIAAIEAFSAPEILILGGSSKNSDFTELGTVIESAKNIKAIIGVGKEWERMKAQFPISNFKFPMIEGAKDMETVVKAASKLGEPGNVVLLSPACASFDMFKNYKERGEQFRIEVNKLES